METKTNNEVKHEKRMPGAFLPVSRAGYEDIEKIARWTNTPLEHVVREMVLGFTVAWNVTGNPTPGMVGQKLADMHRHQGKQEQKKSQLNFDEGWEQ
jgi:hypothetical protein